MQLAASEPPAPAPCTGRQCRDELLLELQTKVREDFTITEKAPTRGHKGHKGQAVWLA